MEKSIKGTRTEQNLLKAFAGESQARSRYVFFASKAKKEGYEQIAGVFAETAEQEKEHAERFFKFLEGGDVEITASYLPRCRSPQMLPQGAELPMWQPPKWQAPPVPMSAEMCIRDRDGAIPDWECSVF